MQVSAEILVTIGSVVAVILTIVYHYRALDKKIDDTRLELKSDIQANSDKIDATRAELYAGIQANSDRMEASRVESKSDIAVLTERVNDLNNAVKDLQGDVRVLQVQVKNIEEKLDSDRVGTLPS